LTVDYFNNDKVKVFESHENHTTTTLHLATTTNIPSMYSKEKNIQIDIVQYKHLTTTQETWLSQRFMPIL